MKEDFYNVTYRQGHLQEGAAPLAGMASQSGPGSQTNQTFPTARRVSGGAEDSVDSCDHMLSGLNGNGPDTSLSYK